MILLWGAFLGILLGWLVGGRLHNLEQLRLRDGVLVGIALLMQLLVFPLGNLGPILPQASVPLHFVSYALLALFLVLNARHWPLAIVGLGLAANLLVIAFNGGYMPADPEALACAGVEGAAEALTAEGQVGNVIRMGSDTRLNFLGDWLYLPKWVPLATAFSLGDLVIALGLVLFFPYAMRRPS